MLFVGRRKKVDPSPNTELYAQPLQFYGQPPLENISLSEFESFAVDRLKCKIVISLFSDIFPPLQVLFMHLSSKIDFNVSSSLFSSLDATAVLKTVENLGVSYVKHIDQYKKKLETEIKALNFPYRAVAVSILKHFSTASR